MSISDLELNEIMSENNAYEQGYDAGYDAGYQDAVEDMKTQMFLRRPVLQSKTINEEADRLLKEKL
jgi:flagellar biosynthesis/type III secretory pathway protein FliH